jgi:hypothetical protein
MTRAQGLGSLFLGLALSFGCLKSTNNPVKEVHIARVGDVVLTVDDLEGLNFGDNPKDSLIFLNAFVKKWIQEQIMYQRAQKQLASSSIQFEKQLEAYKKSLFIYSFQQQLVQDGLDTNITQQAVEDYYKMNEKHFLLKSDILKFRLAIFPLKTKPNTRIRSLFCDFTPNKGSSLESVLRVKAKSFFLNDTSWMSITDASKLLPSGFDLNRERLSKNNLIELQDSTSLYWLYIRDMKMKKSISPLEFETARIKAILLHQKKQSFIKELEEKWVIESLNDKTAEIYVGQPIN